MNRLTNRRRTDGTRLDGRHGIYGLCDGSSWRCITKEGLNWPNASLHICTRNESAEEVRWSWDAPFVSGEQNSFTHARSLLRRFRALQPCLNPEFERFYVRCNNYIIFDNSFIYLFGTFITLTDSQKPECSAGQRIFQKSTETLDN